MATIHNYTVDWLDGVVPPMSNTIEVRERTGTDGYTAVQLGFGEVRLELELIIEVQLDVFVVDDMRAIGDVALVPRPEQELGAEESLGGDEIRECIHD
jgi:hypothetical protein